jgi:hypothetical protein
MLMRRRLRMSTHCPNLPHGVKSGNSGDDLYERSMEVDLHLLTNARSKRQKRANQLDDYLDSPAFEHATTSELEQRFLKHEPWA